MSKKNIVEFNRMAREYKKLAHQANTQLLRLEQYSKQPGFKNVLNWAYRKAQRSIAYWRGEGYDRFSEAVPKNQSITTLRARLKDVQRYLGMASSTKTGIKKVYQDRANTLNKKFGTKFTWESMGKFFESSIGQKMNETDGSPKVLMAIGELQKNEKDIIKALKAGESVNLKLDDPLVEKAVNNILEEYGLDFTKLYK